MDGIEHDDGGRGERPHVPGPRPVPGATGSPPGATPGSWDGEDDRIARFSGVVGEVSDPLTWGLDLEDEALTGLADEQDPTCERFVRAYRCFTGEALEVETLRTAVPDDEVEDVVRAACSGALAAPLHADIAAPVEPEPTRPAPADPDRADPEHAGPEHAGPEHAGPSPADAGAVAADFADAYQDYRSAMRALVAEVDEAPLVTGVFGVDGADAESVAVTARRTTAVYVTAAGRALVVTGPADLVDRVDVVTQPVNTLLSGRGRPPGGEPDATDA
ncbi:hypothetical protein GCM10009809_11930 [Isoptericola hypogeus]|uniref:Uncharacterized protein n=1 Tax=Isoptericola hypogeus TaxID=300179 RepID=A0ABN2J4I6_9MICO